MTIIYIKVTLLSYQRVKLSVFTSVRMTEFPKIRYTIQYSCMDKESPDYAISASFLNPISTSLFFPFFFSRFAGIKYVHGSSVRFFTEILRCNLASLPLFKLFFNFSKFAFFLTLVFLNIIQSRK